MIIADAKDVKQALTSISMPGKLGAQETPYLQLSAKGNACTLRLSDGERHDASVTLEVERDAKLKDRQMILPTALLRAALKPVTKRGVQFSLSEAAGNQVLRVGELRSVICATKTPKPSEWKCVNTDNARHWFTIPAGDLQELLADVSFAASTDLTRPILTGVYLATNRSRLTAVATDTYRLVTGAARIKLGKRLADYALLPTATLRNVQKALSTVAEDELVTVAAVRPAKGRDEAKALSFTACNRQVRGLCLEGTYVNYPKVIPEEGRTYQWIVDVEEARAALTALAPIAKQDACRVVAHLGDGIWHLSAMTANDEGQAVAESTMPVSAEIMAIEEPALAHAFNGEYLTQYLDRLGDGKVTIEANGPLSPLRCSSGKRGLYVLMPMQVMR